MNLLKTVLVVILMSINLLAVELTTNESTLIDSYVKAWPEKFQATIKEKIDVMPIDGKKLIAKWYGIAKPSLETKKNLDINNRFLYNIQEIANAYVKQHGNMEYRSFKLAEICRKDYPELTEKLQELITFAHQEDLKTGKAEAFNKEEVQSFATRKMVKDIRNGQDYGFKLYENGKVIMSVHQNNGVLDGLTEEWYANGKKRKEWPFVNGKFDGVVRYWYENGALKEETNYKNDSKNGFGKEFFENGQLKVSSQYINDKPDGKYQMYYDNGQKFREIDFVNGNKNGKVFEWYKDGSLARDISYRNDKLHGISKIYDSNGKLQKEGEYIDGKSKYYREYQTTGVIGAIKLEENRINDKTVEFKEYSFQADSKDKQYIEKSWTEINDKKEGVLSEYWYWDFKDQRILRSETIYKNGIAQKYTDFTANGIDIAEIQTFNADKNITSVIEYDRFSSDKNERREITLKYSFRGKPQSHGKKVKVGVLERYSPTGKAIIKEIYDDNGNLISSTNTTKYDIDRVVNAYLKDRSYGLGYHWLDIETQFGSNTTEAKKVLDSVVSDVKKQIKLKPQYSPQEAREIMNTIGIVIKSHGFIYDNDHIDVFSDTLIRGAMDCDIISYLYVTIGDKLNLPIYMVVYPEHAALKWEDGSNSFYWEATVHRELSLDYYRNWLIKKYNAYEGVNKKGGYAFPLDKKELLGNVLFLVSTTIQTYFNNEFKSKAYKLYETSNYGNGVRIYGYNSNSVEAIQAGIEKRKNIFGIYDYWDNKIKANSLEVWNDKEAVKYLQDYQYFPDFSSSDFRTRMDNQRLLENIFERLHDYEAIAKLHEYFLINTQGENDKKYHQDKIIEARKKAMSPQ